MSGIISCLHTPRRRLEALAHCPSALAVSHGRKQGAHPGSAICAASSVRFTNLPRPCVKSCALYSRRSLREQYCLHTSCCTDAQACQVAMLRAADRRLHGEVQAQEILPEFTAHKITVQTAAWHSCYL